MILSMKLSACLFSFSELLKDGRKCKGYPDKMFSLLPNCLLTVITCFPLGIQHTKVPENLTETLSKKRFNLQT